LGPLHPASRLATATGFPRPEMGKKTAWQPGFCGFKQEKHTFANSGFKMMKANLRAHEGSSQL